MRKIISFIFIPLSIIVSCIVVAINILMMLITPFWVAVFNISPDSVEKIQRIIRTITDFFS